MYLCRLLQILLRTHLLLTGCCSQDQNWGARTRHAARQTDDRSLSVRHRIWRKSVSDFSSATRLRNSLVGPIPPTPVVPLSLSPARLPAPSSTCHLRIHLSSSGTRGSFRPQPQHGVHDIVLRSSANYLGTSASVVSLGKDTAAFASAFALLASAASAANSPRPSWSPCEGRRPFTRGSRTSS